ncbi:MAG: enoyl-CoA hydratase [Candidatus Dormibacteraceae bacterium]
MSEIQLEVKGHVAVVTLAAPQRRNAFVPDMVQDLLAACEEIDRNQEVGAVVLRALGSSFCSGAHRDVLAEAAKDPARADNYEALSLTYRAFTRVGELLPPSVAAVRGHAVGAGVNLMMATDLRVIAQDAKVISGFARIGIHPGGGHFQLVGRVGGREAAAGLSLFAQDIDGKRAADLGLAWEALPEAEVEPRALEIASSIASDPELARAAARSFRMELGPPPIAWPVALEVERAIQLWSLRRHEG